MANGFYTDLSKSCTFRPSWYLQVDLVWNRDDLDRQHYVYAVRSGEYHQDIPTGVLRDIGDPRDNNGSRDWNAHGIRWHEQRHHCDFFGGTAQLHEKLVSRSQAQDMRDKDVRNDIKHRLEATNAFDEVSLKAPQEDFGSRAGNLKFALVKPFSYAQQDLWDGGPETGLLVTSQFNLTIMVRNSDPTEGDELCELLMNIAIDAIQGKSLAELTNPDQTVFVRAQFQKYVAPTSTLVCIFSYKYIIDGWSNYATEDDET